MGLDMGTGGLKAGYIQKSDFPSEMGFLFVAITYLQLAWVISGSLP